MKSIKLFITGAAALALLLAVTATANAAPPSNDDRAAARNLSIPQNVSSNTAEATVEDGEPSFCSSGSKNSVWFKFTGNGNRVAIGIDAAGDLDAVIDVISFARSQPQNIDCANTDRNGVALLDFRAGRGATYFIRVAERGNSASGSFSLRLLAASDPAKKPGRRLPRSGASDNVNLVSNPSDAWSVTMRAGTTYRINFVADSDEVCPDAYLYAPGESIGGGSSASLNCQDGYTLFTPNRGKGGRYTVVVEASRGTLANQRYHLEAARAGNDDTAPGAYWGGGSRRGSLSGGGIDAVDLYNFDLERTAFVGLRVSSKRDFEVELRSIGGRRLGCSCNGSINRRLKPGTYYAVVYAAAPQSGSYTLKRSVRTITRTGLTFNGSKHATAGAGSSVRLRASVTPPGNGKLVITLERKDPVFGWQFVRTYTGSGSGGGMSIAFSPPGVGEYRAKAEFKGSRTANPSRSGTARLSVRR